MKFIIQNPLAIENYTLHEALLAACEGSVTGGGAFAFATRDGVSLYLRDQAFESFIRDHPFHLVIGMDAITNTQTLEELRATRTTYSNLKVEAFYKEERKFLFHPKFCWFEKSDGSGVLVVGSGNLTTSGLRKNWEAFSMIRLSAEELSQVVDQWNKWLTSCGALMRPLDNSDVVARAAENARSRFVRSSITNDGNAEIEEIEEILSAAPIRPDEIRVGSVSLRNEQAEPVITGMEDPEDLDPWIPSEGDEVLVAEIPKGGSRWNQANFDQRSFEDFFGGTVWDNGYRIVLRNVKANGTLSHPENRQAVSVKSHNWRFEVGAAAGLVYPASGRPVGVFVHVGSRMFLYTLVMPEHTWYHHVDLFLGQQWNGPLNRMRRVITNIESLKASCPDLPFWSIS